MATHADILRQALELPAEARVALVKSLLESLDSEGYARPETVPPRRTIAEALARMPEDSIGVMDAEFARGIEEAIARHRED